jgi:PKD repeat protein
MERHQPDRSGLRDTRAVEVIGEQLLVTDGDDGRSASDPMNHAVFVLDVTGPGGPAPTASFTATPTAGTVPLVVNFSDTSSGGPTSWAWEFGDGGTSDVASPSHTYTSAGTFNATLTVTNGQGSDQTTRTITVNEPSPPIASFTATPTTGTVPLVVNFSDTSSGEPTSWEWNFGDAGPGVQSTQQSPSHTYDQVGSFDITLTATNVLGSSTSTPLTITVNEPPNELIVPLDADTYVSSLKPTKNYASASTMKIKTSSTEYRSLVRFTLSGLNDAPTSVKLRLYVTDASSRGGDWYLVSNDWTESAVVWNNKPDLSSSPVATVGAIVVGTWVEIDLTDAITGNGTYSLEATSTSTNTGAFSTSQGTNAPQVVVVLP